MVGRNGPKSFIVVLPGGIIEIPQDSDKSWLTLFYRLPRELAEKWQPAYELPRCPYEVLRTDKYDHIVCDDMLYSCAMKFAKGIYTTCKIYDRVEAKQGGERLWGV